MYTIITKFLVRSSNYFTFADKDNIVIIYTYKAKLLSFAFVTNIYFHSYV